MPNDTKDESNYSKQLKQLRKNFVGYMGTLGYTKEEVFRGIEGSFTEGKPDESSKIYKGLVKMKEHKFLTVVALIAAVIILTKSAKKYFKKEGD